MPQEARKHKNKHQVRTEETQAKILAAAEATFSERGFEKLNWKRLRLEPDTLGGNLRPLCRKEDLLLALMEHRVLTRFVAIRQIIEAEPE